MNKENQKPTTEASDAALTASSGSRFTYDTELGCIYDTLKEEWITDLIDADRLLNEYADRENKCATMDEAEKIALIRALQEISDAMGFLGGEHSPREIVERVKLLCENKQDTIASGGNTRSAYLTPEDSGLSLRVISGPVGTMDGNWQRVSYFVALDYEGREIWKGDYHLGIGHVHPKKAGDAWNGMNAHRFTKDEKAMLNAWQKPGNVKFSDPENQAKLAAKLAEIQKVEPKLEDVTYSLLSEGAAHFDSLTFEEWAQELDYSADSRNAEKIFNACVETGRALSCAIPREKLEALREWAMEY